MTEHLNVRGAQRFQTPSYILSPLDSGPQAKFRMAISFSPFLPFRPFGNTAGNGGVFLLFLNATATKAAIKGLFLHYKTGGFPWRAGVKKPRFKINTFFQKIKILFFRKNKVLAIFDFLKIRA
jgi:hypothetical protein